eukprot:19226-Heterococcus_DN1.PRE.4
MPLVLRVSQTIDDGMAAMPTAQCLIIICCTFDLAPSLDAHIVAMKPQIARDATRTQWYALSSRKALGSIRSGCPTATRCLRALTPDLVEYCAQQSRFDSRA